MAHAHPTLIDALRETAQRLENGAAYAWGHHGTCNCGNLLQVLTPFDQREILRMARTGVGEWTELAEEYCGVSDLPVDRLIGVLMEHGLTPTDIRHIEYLDDREVLCRLPGGFRWLSRNVREDVVAYLRAMACLLEEKAAAEGKDRLSELLDELSLHGWEPAPDELSHASV
jgi:hypothetical protein